MTEWPCAAPVSFVELSVDEATADAEAANASTKLYVIQQGTRFSARRADCRLTSPYRMCRAPRGEAAGKLAGAANITDALGVLAPGETFELFSSGYLLYRPGDFMGLHTDRAGCDVTVLISLSRSPVDVEILNQLVGRDPVDLAHLSKAGDGFAPEAGANVTLLRPGEGVAFRATSVPHQRRPAPEPVLLLSFSYQMRYRG